jgi:hypothetical protein
MVLESQILYMPWDKHENVAELNWYLSIANTKAGSNVI